MQLVALVVFGLLCKSFAARQEANFNKHNASNTTSRPDSSRLDILNTPPDNIPKFQLAAAKSSSSSSDSLGMQNVVSDMETISLTESMPKKTAKPKFLNRLAANLFTPPDVFMSHENAQADTTLFSSTDSQDASGCGCCFSACMNCKCCKGASEGKIGDPEQ